LILSKISIFPILKEGRGVRRSRGKKKRIIGILLFIIDKEYNKTFNFKFS
jgi:hypothetical protein